MTDTALPPLPPVIRNKGFRLKERVASGGFSEVYRASWTRMPNQDLAAKIIDLSKVDKVWVLKSLKNEMKIIKILKHPNVIRVYELVKTSTNAYIFMDFAQNGSVYDVLQTTNKPLPESRAKKYFRDIISGLVYIHSRGVAHRDLKPDNFLIDANDKIMISDFGFAVIGLDNSERLMKGTRCGTAEYMAIEIKLNKEGQAYDAKAADLYSLGIALYLIVYFDFPFNPRNESECIRKQKARDFKHKPSVPTSQHFKDLIYSLLNPNPRSRITAREVICHRWLTSE